MYHILRQVVQDSRDFAREVKEDSEKVPVIKQRIQKFEAQLALTAGRRDAAEDRRFTGSGAVIAQRLEITPHNLRSSLRQAGQKNKDGSTLLPLQRVLSKRLDEAKVQPGEEPTEPMTDQA
eukprot:g24272.t1